MAKARLETGAVIDGFTIGGAILEFARSNTVDHFTVVRNRGLDSATEASIVAAVERLRAKPAN